RGMHFQHAPHAEKKLIRCLAGRVFDVVLDLRKGSPTFLQWRGVELAAGDDRALLVPEGCAHGFQVLEAGSSLLYLH
ncbi:dTDP-4-dehydrorhamnose 3,5-epimerase family protein, partial [Salmonella enterica]